MDALSVIVQQTDDKVSDLKNFLADGRCESFEDYQKVCGEIRGLLIARGYILDLKQNLEIADEWAVNRYKSREASSGWIN